jgi:hypothetical protein
VYSDPDLPKPGRELERLENGLNSCCVIAAVLIGLYKDEIQILQSGQPERCTLLLRIKVEMFLAGMNFKVD